MDEDWHYRIVVGKLILLEKFTKTRHRLRGTSVCLKASQAAAIKRLGKYLLETKDKGMILNPQGGYSFECFCDADLCGN
jgi:hypothetical protein